MLAIVAGLIVFCLGPLAGVDPVGFSRGGGLVVVRAQN